MQLSINLDLFAACDVELIQLATQGRPCNADRYLRHHAEPMAGLMALSIDDVARSGNSVLTKMVQSPNE